MTETIPDLPAETGGTDITRFNALRHGVLPARKPSATGLQNARSGIDCDAINA